MRANQICKLVLPNSYTNLKEKERLFSGAIHTVSQTEANANKKADFRFVSGKKS